MPISSDLPKEVANNNANKLWVNSVIVSQKDRQTTVMKWNLKSDIKHWGDRGQTSQTKCEQKVCLRRIKVHKQFGSVKIKNLSVNNKQIGINIEVKIEVISYHTKSIQEVEN